MRKKTKPVRRPNSNGILSNSTGLRTSYHAQMHSPIVRSKALTFSAGRRGARSTKMRPTSPGCGVMGARINRLRKRPKTNGYCPRPTSISSGAVAINATRASGRKGGVKRSNSTPSRVTANKSAKAALFKRSAMRPSTLLDPLKSLKLPQLNDGTENASPSLIPKMNYKQKQILTEPSTLKFGVSSVRGKRNYMEDDYKIVENLVGTYSIPLAVDSNQHTIGASSSVDVASKAKEEISPPRTLFFGVYDGHAGKRCSNRIARNIPMVLSRHPSFYSDLPSALMDTYLHVDEKFLGWARRHRCPDGSTACTVVRRGDTLFICNTGDSRAILSRKVCLPSRRFFFCLG